MVRTDNKGRRLNYGDDKKKKISINNASSDSSVIRKDSRIWNEKQKIEKSINNVFDENDFPIEWLSYNDRDVSLLDDKGLKEWIAENPRTFKAIENGLRDKAVTYAKSNRIADGRYDLAVFEELFFENRDLIRNMVAKRFSLFAYDDMWSGSGGQKTFERNLNKYLERSVNEIETAHAIWEEEKYDVATATGSTNLPTNIPSMATREYGK